MGNFIAPFLFLSFYYMLLWINDSWPHLDAGERFVTFHLRYLRNHIWVRTLIPTASPAHILRSENQRKTQSTDLFQRSPKALS